MLTWLLAHFGYVGIVGLLVAGGLGAPIPEEVVQLTVGYMARHRLLMLTPALLAAYCGILAGDFLVFRLAQRHGERVLDRVGASRLLTAKRRAWLAEHFHRHAFLTIMVVRYLPGLRMPAYITAGTHQVPTRTFLMADGIAALLSVPLVVSLGYAFAGQLDEVKERVHQGQLVILGVVVAAVLAWVLLQRWRARRLPAACLPRTDVPATHTEPVGRTTEP